MIDATKLIETTCEPFALAGLCVMHRMDMINSDGDVEECVLVSPDLVNVGIAVRVENIPKDKPIEEVVAGVYEIARQKGLVA